MHYAQMRSMDISNGEGIGVSLFVQGCRFHCFNCFNTEAWDFDKGNVWTDETEAHFLELANRPFISRVSILGGEPLATENEQDVLKLLQEIKVNLPQKKIWLYTGYTWEEIFSCSADNAVKQEIIQLCDIVVDGRYMNDLRDMKLKWKGSSNQRVIDVQRTLCSESIILKENENGNT